MTEVASKLFPIEALREFCIRVSVCQTPTRRRLPSTATVDGDNGLALVVGPQANRMAMDVAGKCGSGWVGVRNTNHFGIAGYYVLQALERDLIGWAMTNSTKLVAPLWGAEHARNKSHCHRVSGQSRAADCD